MFKASTSVLQYFGLQLTICDTCDLGLRGVLLLLHLQGGTRPINILKNF